MNYYLTRMALIIITLVPLFIFVTFFIIFRRIMSVRKNFNVDRLKTMLNQVNGSKDDLMKMAQEMKDEYAHMDHGMYGDYNVTKTTYCKHCSRTIDKDSRFCKYCGQRQ